MKALDEAAQIAKKFSGKITLIHAYPVPLQPNMLTEPSVSGSLCIPILTGAEFSGVTEAARELGNRILEDREQKAKAKKSSSSKTSHGRTCCSRDREGGPRRKFRLDRDRC